MISRHWSGAQPVDQGQDHGVDGDRLAGAGGAGDQQMRHAREIDDHRLAADGLAEAERQLGGALVVVARRRAIRASRPSRASDWAVRCRWRCGPDTTATRADTALIERAMSSASPITRDDLMPGAGSSSYSVTTGPGRALMISPRTPKSPSTLSSAAALASIDVLRQRGALGDALRGQQIERGQLDSRCRSGAAARARRGAAARRGLRVVLVLFVRLDVGSAGMRHAAVAVETRLLPRAAGAGARRRGSGVRGARREQPADARLAAQQRVHEPAEPGRGAIVSVVVVIESSSASRAARVRSAARRSRQPKPAAIATVTAVATPNRADSHEQRRCRPAARRAPSPARAAARRRSRRRARSAAARRRLRGSEEAKAGGQERAERSTTAAAPFSPNGRCDSSRQPQQRYRQHQHDRRRGRAAASADRRRSRRGSRADCAPAVWWRG